MTLNVISDIHCGYDSYTDSIVWNMEPLCRTKENNSLLTEEESVKYYTEQAIDFLVNTIAKMSRDKANFEEFDNTHKFIPRPFLSVKCSNYTECLNLTQKF